MTGEDILKAGLIDAHNDVHGDAAQALDPTMIISIITSIMEVIRSCRSPAGAERQIARGGALSKHHVRKILKKKGYPRAKRNEVAERMAEKGRNLTADEMQAILADSDDVPEPTPDSGGDFPYWPGLSILLLLLLPTSVNASEEYRWWPMVETAKATTAESYWPEPIKPRRARILFFKTNGCVSCLEDEALLFPQLREAGYKIGESPDSHIQIVNVDEHPEYRQKFRPVGYPSYVAVLDERETARWTGRIQRNRLIQMQHNVVARQNGDVQQQQARR